ncbi:MAG: type II toxin-antitoxin system RelE/ParE family toxin [Candidatus Eisenbacteria bacterium]|nr:type II toxin-antitoxin system RelE/ParE family toxin [Candidatus Eisenbacteria bacterium]
MRIRFTDSARTEFLRQLAFIHRDRPSAATKLRLRAERVIRRLVDHPESGRRIPEFSNLPHREVLAHPLRFFYRLDRQTIWIVAVWHEAQSPRAPESDRP